MKKSFKNIKWVIDYRNSAGTRRLFEGKYAEIIEVMDLPGLSE